MGVFVLEYGIGVQGVIGRNFKNNLGMTQRAQIIECEKKLLEAFVTCNTEALDELLHDEVVFVIPNGNVINKARVLHNHRSGNATMFAVSTTDLVAHTVDRCAVVSMVLHLDGEYFDQVVHRKFRYLRVWEVFDGKWKVISVSGVPLIQ